MKKILAGCLLLAIASSASAQVFFEGSFEEAMDKAKTENKKVLIDFHSYT